MKKLKRFLALFLVLSMMLGVVPFGVFAAESNEAPAEETVAPVEETEAPVEVTEAPAEETEAPAEETEAPVEETEAPAEETVAPVEVTHEAETLAVAAEEFYKIFHLDVGRKYFTVDEVKGIIDTMASKGYSHLELAFGNDGLRFLLDDMSVTVGTTTYSSEDVTAGVKEGNVNYSHSGEWSEAEMGEVIAYAKKNGIEIIPLLNTPGHMDAIVDAMAYVGIDGDYNGSARTVDVTNETAVAFTQALVNKYIEYFAANGSTMFHIGADEYANDVYTSGSMGFGRLQSVGHYDEYVTYINELAGLVKAAGMTPVAFNDGIYFNNVTSSGTFDTDIVVTYWTSGWTNYTTASASTLAGKGHSIINTNDGWYYVLGRNSGSTYSYTTASSNVASTSVTDVPGSNDPAAVGAMMCVWCDTPSASYSSNAERVTYLLETWADSNPTYFTGPNEVQPEEVVEPLTLENNVTVTASGVVSGTAAETTAPAIEGAKEVVAFTVELATETGAYTGEATVTIPVPADWTNVRGGVLASDSGEEVLNIEGTLENGYFTFVVPHFSDVIAYDVQKTETVTVSVGGTTTVTVEGVDYSGDVDETELDENYAEVSVEFAEIPGGSGEPEKASSLTSGGTYIIGNGQGRYLVMSGSSISSTTDYIDATEFTITGSDGSWKIQNGNYYLRHNNNNLSASTTNSNNTWSYNGTRFYYTSGRTTYRLNTNNSGTWRVSDSTSRQGAAYTVTPTDPVKTTTITFTGVAIGTTYVTVGDTRYTINVTDAPPSDALTSTRVTLEYFITNYPVHTSNSTSSASSTTISTSTDGVTSNEGVALVDIAPDSGYSNFDGWVQVYYWQSMRQDEDNHQTDDSGSGTDKTVTGTTMTHVRYHNGAWQYKTADGAWNYFVSGDQLVAYYLQKTDVTTEIDTYSKDWGYDTGSTTPDTSSGNGQAALTVAVVYPDGTVSPAEGSMYANSTTIFNYWSGRDIGIVAPVNNSDYNISKMTVTYGTRIGSSSSNVWNTSATISWEKVTNEAGSQWYDETTVWTAESGTTPMVNGAEAGITWKAKNTAILVLIYLETVSHEDNLIVQWVDDSASGALISEMEVAVSYEEGAEPITYYNGLKQSSALPEAGVGGEFTLDDNAYVTNSSNVNQTFNKDITIIPDVAAQYRSGLYEYTGADLSADGKTLTLHYSIDSAKLSPLYVVDFGLPVTFPVTDLVENINEVSSIEVAAATNYGTAVLNTNGTDSIADDTITYAPTAVLRNIDVLKITVAYSGESSTFRMGFVPATTVYYEEGFAAYTGSWSGGTNKGTAAQQTQIAGEPAEGVTYYNYGYDAAYASNTGATEASTSTFGDTATFTFTGTGVEIYANGDGSTGVVAVKIKNVDTGKTVKFYQVDTAVLAGTTGATTGQTGTFYNLPVVSVQGLDPDTYEVTVQHVKRNAEATSATVKLDGFRVYNTIGADSTAYVAAEQNPNYAELRDWVLTSANVIGMTGTKYTVADNIVTQVYEDTNTTKTAVLLSNNTAFLTDEMVKDLLDNGPKNELYLYQNQAVTFTMNDGITAQVGLKAPAGATSYTITGVNGTVSLESTTDMFYHSVSGAVTITNTGDKPLSITQLKYFGTTSVANLFTEVTAVQLASALESIGYVETPEIPVEPGEADVTFENASLSLTGDIGVNFYVKLSETVTADPEARMVFTVNGVAQSFALSEALVAENGSYRFSCKVHAKQMADEITAQIYGSEGAIGEAMTYSAKTYCDAMLGMDLSGYNGLEALLKAMLNYGAAAQVHFGYNTENLANAALAEEDKDLTVSDDLSACKAVISGVEEGIEVYSASLILESTTTIRFYFRLTGEKAIGDYAFTVNGEAVTPVEAGELYYVEVADITAKDLDTVYTATVGGLSIAYSGLSYVYAAQNYEGTTASLAEVLNAMYLYNQAANAYFGA